MKFMGFIFKDKDSQPVNPKAARLRVFLLCAPFGLMGVFALVLLVHDGLLGGLNRQKATGLLSAAVVCGGLMALILGINAKKMAIQAIGKTSDDDRAPWLRRKEWADGRIRNFTRKAVVLVWVIVGLWSLALAVLSLVALPPLLHRSSIGLVLAVLLPVLGLGVLFFTAYTTIAWHRFGRATFQMDHFPAPAGQALSGKIHIPSRLQPELGWQARISCVKRRTTGATNNLQVTEKVLWRDEKWLRPDLPQAMGGETEVPIYFQLPQDLPESSLSAAEGIHWKLEVSATVRGPNFHATFEVPVFKLAENPPSRPDLTQPHGVALDEIRSSLNTRIQATPTQDGGQEFVFPAGRTPGIAAGAGVFCLIWTSITALLIFKHAPLPFVMVFSGLDLLMWVFLLDLCFRRIRVTIHQSGLKMERSWFGIRQKTSFPANRILSIVAEIGATVGHAVYYDLKLQTTDGKGLVLAKNIKHQPEAEWLAASMRESVKMAKVKVAETESKPE